MRCQSVKEAFVNQGHAEIISLRCRKKLPPSSPNKMEDFLQRSYVFRGLLTQWSTSCYVKPCTKLGLALRLYIAFRISIASKLKSKSTWAYRDQTIYLLLKEFCRVIHWSAWISRKIGNRTSKIWKRRNETGRELMDQVALKAWKYILNIEKSRCLFPK